jgi:hypothetical protein
MQSYKNIIDCFPQKQDISNVDGHVCPGPHMKLLKLYLARPLKLTLVAHSNNSAEAGISRLCSNAPPF